MAEPIGKEKVEVNSTSPVAPAAAQPDAPVHARNCDLPMRKDLPADQLTATPPQKDINKTFGGRFMSLFTNYGVNFLLNSALSLGITYFLNPRPEVREFKESAVESIGKVFKSANPVKTLDSVRSSLEVGFQMISGFLITFLMMPMVKHREKAAYKINQMLGKDKDVLPESMQPKQEPKTLEDKVEQETKKRVNRKFSGTDLWYARFLGMGMVWGGDFAVNRLSRALEAKDIPSMDTASWRLGQKIYKKLPDEMVTKWNDFFKAHGASIDNIRVNMKDHFERLEETERKFGAKPGEPLNENRMVIAEQTRIIGKELFWTLAIAMFIHKFIELFNKHRVRQEHKRVVADLKKEGIIPEDHKVVFDENMQVKEVIKDTQKLSGKNPENVKSSWVEKSTSDKARPEKIENFVKGVETSRTSAEQQPTIY